MGRAIRALCVLIVSLQILVGVPVLVCLVFFGLHSGGIGPLAVEVHAGHVAAAPVVVAGPPAPPPVPLAMGLPPNIIPTPSPARLDNPILTSRAEHGSPLVGTVLGETLAPETEQQLFVAAFEKAAAENLECTHTRTDVPHDVPAAKPAIADAEVPGPQAGAAAACDQPREKAAQFAIHHLYAMAQIDELAGEYDRADQWRSLAREIRRQADESRR